MDFCGTLFDVRVRSAEILLQTAIKIIIFKCKAV